MSRWGELIKHDEERCADPQGCACMCQDCDACFAGDVVDDPDKDTE